MIFAFGLFIGVLADILKLSLGWVYNFMSICIGSAIIPLWNMMTWEKASGTGAVIAAWAGLVLAVSAWIITFSIVTDGITIDNLRKKVPMLTGNLVAILSSGLIHVVISKVNPQKCFSFEELDSKMNLVENDES